MVFLGVIVLLGVISFYYDSLWIFTGQSVMNEDYDKETAILTRVIDGDTIVVTGPVIGNQTHI